jgi:hypothetical protein
MFIAITFEPKEDVLSFMKKHPFDFEIVTLSRQDIEQKINFGYPTTIIVDKSGAITYVESGGPLDPDQATDAIRQKLKPKIEEALHY